MVVFMFYEKQQGLKVLLYIHHVKLFYLLGVFVLHQGNYDVCFHQ